MATTNANGYDKPGMLSAYERFEACVVALEKGGLDGKEYGTVLAYGVKLKGAMQVALSDGCKDDEDLQARSSGLDDLLKRLKDAASKRGIEPSKERVEDICNRPSTL